MAFRFPQFRRFSLRLLAWLLSLLFTALAATSLLVSRFNEDYARSRVATELEQGAHFVDEAIKQRAEYLAASANVMTDDRAIQEALHTEQPNTDELQAALKGYTARVGAPVIALFDFATRMVAISDANPDNENRGPFHFLVRTAKAERKSSLSDFAYLNHKLHLLVVVPHYAPYPNIDGWFGLAFPLDQVFAERIKAVTRLEFTFVSTEELPRLSALASTWPASGAAQVVAAVAENRKSPARIRSVTVEGADNISLFRTREMLGDGPVIEVLQRPLEAELASARVLEHQLRLISLAALAAATLGAFWIARGISRPIQQLATHTKHVAAGDYARRIDLHREDELGQLATSFNHMTAGLAERDRVRDLLGKVVSPEIATQLLSSEIRLGGEEREVTILFADIRNFTALSEKMTPTQVLTLLNRYLDQMSAEIEMRGGVIDKYIGDAIMALFGAPVADPNAADRAVEAAVAMGVALEALNRQLVTEGFPRLEIGIGINTARVVAGNMGSKTRLNYTVIGDGVNLAARLETLTKEHGPGFRIIISEATRQALRNFPLQNVRALGDVSVKGKEQPVKVFAIHR